MDKKLQETLADVFGVRPGDIKPELGREDIETWDSLKQMDLVLSLERAYNVTLEMADIIAMTNIEEIIKVLKAKGVEIEA